MFYALSKTLDVFLSPFTWALIAIALAIPWRRRPRRPSQWRRRRAFGILALLILMPLSMDIVANRMRYALEHAVSPTYRPEATYDVVVLLGGVTDERVTAETGQPAFNENVERLTMTYRLLATHHARVAIVSGAAVNPALQEYSEARLLKNQLVEWGIEPSRVILEDRARNTYENAVYSKQLASEMRLGDEIVIVTSAFHMRRAIECFNAVGWKVDTMMVDYRARRARAPDHASFLPRSSNFEDSSAVLRETFGLHVYRWRGFAKTELAR